MKTKIKLSVLIFLALTMIGCQNVEKKESLNQEEKLLNQKEFGKLKAENDSLEVEININQFNNWIDLARRTEEIVCNDSLPIIKLTTDKELKTIYFHNICWDGSSFQGIKEKNVVEIHNEMIKKNERIFPMDSLKSVLRRDVKNNGENPRLSENPNKLTILISYDNEFQNLPNILNRITKTYEKITNKTDINIRLFDKENIKIPTIPKN